MDADADATKLALFVLVGNELGTVQKCLLQMVDALFHVRQPDVEMVRGVVVIGQVKMFCDSLGAGDIIAGERPSR